MDKVRVLIAGDDEEACWLLRLVLQQQSDVAVVGYARSARELSVLIPDQSPQVVLLDLDAPVQGVVAAVRMARLQGRQIGILGLAGNSQVDEALRREADILLDKNSPLEELSATLRAMVSRQARPYAVLDAHSSATGEFEQILTLYIANLERSHREMEERLNLMQFWLQHLETSGLIQTEKTTGDVATTAVHEGSVAPSYTLSVDSFFNAQHYVSVGGTDGDLHPHSWRVSVKLRQESLGQDHLLLGFADAKRILRGEISWFDGKVLNDLPQFAGIPPTTENVAALLYNSLKMAMKGTSAMVGSVTVWENPVNSVTYSEDRQ